LGISFLNGHAARSASIRTVANQPIAEEFYEKVLRPAWQRLADRFATMMKEGRLKFADPWITAMHWKGLNEWDMLERHLLCASACDNPSDIVTAATAAADAFLKVYANPPRAGEAAQ
ncbi:MAG: TetR/AcrR family transcriptional regulator C-terminal domain-containing protein, partial [Allosphingosinicella sp.]